MKHNKKCLTSINVGETAKIKDLLVDKSMKRRLCDLGLIKESLVECVLKSPSSNPIAYRICGAVIAIRNEDSDNIIIY